MDNWMPTDMKTKEENGCPEERPLPKRNRTSALAVLFRKPVSPQQSSRPRVYERVSSIDRELLFGLTPSASGLSSLDCGTL